MVSLDFRMKRSHGARVQPCVKVGMQSFLKSEGYDQIPQLSVGNHKFNLKKNFTVLNPNRRKGKGGRTRAVLIGINYPGSSCPLDGACNDVTSMRQFIVDQGYDDDKDHMRVLRDDGEPGALMPTKKNILAALRWLVQGAMKNDSLFLHFSGHGVSMKDTDGDEEDGMDEAMCPCDFMEMDDGPDGGRRVIRDDDIYDIVVKPLKKGVSLVAVMDCCHSGTLMDLPYTCTLTQRQFEQLEEEMAMGVPVKRSVKDVATNAITFLPNLTLKLVHGTASVIDKTLDTIEASFKATARTIEKITGIGKGTKRGYKRLQKDLKRLTTITFKFEPRRQRDDDDDDNEPPTDEEKRAELVHKFVF